MSSWISLKLMILGLVLICIQKVISSRSILDRRLKLRMRMRDFDLGSGYGFFDHHSIDDYDDYEFEDPSSGYSGSGDKFVIKETCNLPTHVVSVSSNEYVIAFSQSNICDLVGESNHTKCLHHICGCIASELPLGNVRITIRNVKIRGNCPGTHSPPTRSPSRTPTFVSTFSQSSSSKNYDIHKPSTRPIPRHHPEDEDEDDDEYMVEIDRLTVTDHENMPPGVLTQPGLLASIMGGTIIGLLCAVLLVMFLVYRIKKRRIPRFVHPPFEKAPHCPPLKGYTKNFDDCDVYA